MADVTDDAWGEFWATMGDCGREVRSFRRLIASSLSRSESACCRVERGFLLSVLIDPKNSYRMRLSS